MRAEKEESENCSATSSNSSLRLKSKSETKKKSNKKTLPKALRTQVLTASTSHFGLEGLVQYAW